MVNLMIPIFAMFIGITTYFVLENKNYSLIFRKNFRIIACFMMVFLLIFGVYSFKQDMKRVEELEETRIGLLEDLEKIYEIQVLWEKSLQRDINDQDKITKDKDVK